MTEASYSSSMGSEGVGGAEYMGVWCARGLYMWPMVGVQAWPSWLYKEAQWQAGSRGRKDLTVRCASGYVY